MDVYDSIYDMYMLINTACNMLKTHILTAWGWNKMNQYYKNSLYFSF